MVRRESILAPISRSVSPRLFGIRRTVDRRRFVSAIIATMSGPLDSCHRALKAPMPFRCSLMAPRARRDCGKRANNGITETYRG